MLTRCARIEGAWQASLAALAATYAGASFRGGSASTRSTAFLKTCTITSRVDFDHHRQWRSQSLCGGRGAGVRRQDPKGDVLVDNFNNLSNLQGTGGTIIDLNPDDQADDAVRQTAAESARNVPAASASPRR